MAENKLLEWIPTWISLRALINSKFARLTIIVPIIGWLLIYNDTLVKYIEYTYEIELSDTLNWRLYSFYLGLFLISGSSIIYIIFSPRDISLYNTDIEYIRETRLKLTDTYAQMLVESFGTKPISWNSPPDAYRNQDTKAFCLKLKHEENEENIINLLLEVHDKMNKSWPYARLLSLILFIFGVFLTFMPTLSTVRWAFEQLIKYTIW